MRSMKWGLEGGGCAAIPTKEGSSTPKPQDTVTLAWLDVSTYRPEAAGHWSEERSPLLPLLQMLWGDDSPLCSFLPFSVHGNGG